MQDHGPSPWGIAPPDFQEDSAAQGGQLGRQVVASPLATLARTRFGRICGPHPVSPEAGPVAEEGGKLIQNSMLRKP